MSDTKRNSTPKIIFTCRYRLALTNPDNKVSSSFHEKNMIKDFPSIKGVGQYKITLQLIKEVSVDIIANVNIK